MCGIIGYTGTSPALPILLEGLKTLEYRGYDSAGVALGGSTPILTVKSQGKLRQLEEKLKTHATAMDATCGIGHTRWATHGSPSDRNAHPHTTTHLSLVHNGIIENDAELRTLPDGTPIPTVSETDTEVAAWLIDRLYTETRDPIRALFTASEQLRGSFAFAVLFHDRPNQIYAMRRDSPLILAQSHLPDHSGTPAPDITPTTDIASARDISPTTGTGSASDTAPATGAVLASDVPAILRHNRTYYRLAENTVAVLQGSDIRFYHRDGNEVTAQMPTEHVDWNIERAQKGGYPHFMRKEIDEQPQALHNTLEPRIRNGLPHFDLPELDTDHILRYRTIHMVACGTAMHAGLIGKRVIEQYARIPVHVEIASEFRYRDPILSPEHDLVILLSQSGETADTLAALRHAKSRGVTTLAIVNVVGSSVAREADHVLYTWAGPEIAVASTKAYSVQCVLLTLLALRLAHAHGILSEADLRLHIQDLRKNLPPAVTAATAMSDRVAAIAPIYKDAEHLFYIGRGIDADLCTEGSLKLKEISYIHSESYPAGELKHGTISLIVDGTPVIALLTDETLCEKTLSAIREVRSRGARILAIVTPTIQSALHLPADDLLILPNTSPLLTPFPAVTILQLLAYHIAVARGCEVDQPRNLAKSVTVE